MTDDKQKPDDLSEARRIMGNLSRMPHKPHKPIAPKPKSRSARKGRVHKAKSRS